MVFLRFLKLLTSFLNAIIEDITCIICQEEDRKEGARESGLLLYEVVQSVNTEAVHQKRLLDPFLQVDGWVLTKEPEMGQRKEDFIARFPPP
ncbi:MAG: hypothetical protein DRI93_02835 [Aquificota bacterium]|nr:MAG: hypothetical protein DRI93_02835 [Aquificota bacterium]